MKKPLSFERGFFVSLRLIGYGPIHWMTTNPCEL
jgi:hypothetical protein